MKKSDLLAAAVFAVALVLFLILSGAFYTVDQTEQVIITQFGEPVVPDHWAGLVSRYHSCKA